MPLTEAASIPKIHKKVRFKEPPPVRIELGEFPSRQVGEVLKNYSETLSPEVRGILVATAQVVTHRFLDGEISSEHVWDVVLRRHDPTRNALDKLKYKADDLAETLEKQITTGRRQAPWTIDHPQISIDAQVSLTPEQQIRLVTPDVELALQIAHDISKREARAARRREEDNIAEVISPEHLLVGLFLSGVARGVSPGLLFLTGNRITFETFFEAYRQQQKARGGNVKNGSAA